MKQLGWMANFVGKANWVILFFMGILALFLTDNRIFAGVLVGGIIAAVNFHLLNRTVQKHLHPEEVVSMGRRSLLCRILFGYYIRFFLSAGLLFLCVYKHLAHPLGLLAGVSVVVISILLGTMILLADSLFKEAV